MRLDGNCVFFANIESTDNVGHTALTLSVAHNHLDCVRYLLDIGANVSHRNYGAVRLAATSGHAEALQILVDHGADINCRYGDLTALIEASYNGRIGCVRVLLDHGADKAAMTETGLDPLLAAITKGHKAIAELLVDSGVDPFSNNGVTLSAVAFAESRGRHDIANSISHLFTSKTEYQTLSNEIHIEESVENILLF